MDHYQHRVAGVYVYPQEAENTLQKLREGGLQPEQLHLLTSDRHATHEQEGSRDVLKDVLKDTAIGTVVGGGVGALGQAAIVAANVSLFVASPLLAPLAMVGWGAAVGAIAGAGAGIAQKSGDFSNFVIDAINNGYVVLLAYTRSGDETELARDIIAASGKEQHEMQVVRL